MCVVDAGRRLADSMELQSHAGGGGGAAATVRSRLFSKAKVKSLCMTAVIVAAFIVCWTPYQVVFIVHTFADMGQVEHRYVLWIFFFGMANSMVNPLIYGAFHSCRCTRCRTTGVVKPQARSVGQPLSSLFYLILPCLRGKLPPSAEASSGPNACSQLPALTFRLLYRTSWSF